MTRRAQRAVWGPESLAVFVDEAKGLTDACQAERFADANRNRLRYDHTRRKWFVFQAPRWVPDPDGQVYRLAIEAARILQLEGKEMAGSKSGDSVISFAKGCQSDTGIRRILNIAQNLPPIANVGGLWDPDLLLVGTPNGVLNLRTGRFRRGRPEDMLTLSTGVVYDPEAKCPRWKRFLREIFRGDMELVRYVQRAIGYSLTGLTTEQIWWLLHGTGANGKTTFVNVLKYVLGTYARTIPFNAILLPERPIPDDIAGLVGKRFVCASEAIEDRHLNEGRIKALTGGDPFPVRRLYEEWFEFKPELKLWLCCNHKPAVKDSSYGFWRRVHVLPFTQRFEGDRRDPYLEQKLIQEGPGILRWGIQGNRAWLKGGLRPPADVLLATEQYQQESDQLGEFLAERCEIDPAEAVSATQLYGEYCQWVLSRNVPYADRLSLTAFGTRMSDRFDKAHRQQGNVYCGLRLRRSA